MPTDRLPLLVVGAFGGSFVLGRMLLSNPAGGTTDAVAPAADDRAPADPFLSDSATIEFPGVLEGVYPFTDQFGNPVTPPSGGGLPGGGSVIDPGYIGPPIYHEIDERVQVEGSTTTSTSSAPATLGPKPAGATGWIAVSGGAFFRYVSGGSRTSVSGRIFSAWVAGPVSVKWSDGTASCWKVLSSAYKGWLIGTAAATVKFTRA